MNRSHRIMLASAATAAMSTLFYPGDDTIPHSGGPGDGGPPVGRGPGKGHKQHLRKIKPKGGPKRKAKARPPKFR